MTPNANATTTSPAGTASGNGHAPQTAAAKRVAERQQEQAEHKQAVAEIVRTCELLFPPGAVTELRILGARTDTYRAPHTEAGYFDDWRKLAEATWSIPRATGAYIVPNVVNPDLLARRLNRIEPALKDFSTSDTAILRRRWLLIDIDPERPTGISSTNAEHESALVRAAEIRDWLGSYGWPNPILADSGNGGHLLYRVDLPADDGGLVNRCLVALGVTFSRDSLKIDSTVGNPARIWKLYGTPAAKGDSTRERPHRMSRILEAPAEPVVVPSDLLESLAATVAADAPKRQPTASRGQHNGHFDLDLWIAEHCSGISGPEPWQGGRRWIFDICPWNPEHTDKSAAIVQLQSGAFDAKCHHDHCSGKGWHDLRDVLEPGWRDRQHHAAPAIRTPIPVGTVVKALDRGNYGDVVSDNGDSLSVHFVSDQGQHATIDLPRSKLRRQDGSPLDEADGPIIPAPCTVRELVTAHPTLRPAVIEGLLRVGETMNVVAAPKRGKSWLLNSLALTVGAGSTWLDTFPSTPGRVLIIDGELHPEVIAHRLPAVADAMGLDRAVLDTIDVLPLRGVGADLITLASFIQSIEPGRYALVILDAWYRFLPLGFSENDNAQVMALYNRIDCYTAHLQSAWVNVHHASKGDQSAKSTTDVGSGAGSQSRAADTHLIIRAHEEEDVAVIEAVVRSWPPVEPISIRWTYPVWQLDSADPRKLQRPRDRTAKEGRDVRLDEDRREIVQAMMRLKNPETQTAIRNDSKIRSERFGFAWASLLNDKTIRFYGKLKKDNGRFYDTYIIAPEEG